MNLFSRLIEVAMLVPRWLKLLFQFFAKGNFLKALVGGVVRTTPQLVIQLLLFFGLTMAVNNIAVPAFRAEIVSRVGAVPATWINYMALCKIDQFITILLSAFAIVAARRVRLRPANPSLWS